MPSSTVSLFETPAKTAWSSYSSANWLRSGCSPRQTGHHDSQKLSTTGVPRCSARLKVSPSNASNEKSGASLAESSPAPRSGVDSRPRSGDSLETSPAQALKARIAATAEADARLLMHPCSSIGEPTDVAGAPLVLGRYDADERCELATQRCRARGGLDRHWAFHRGEVLDRQLDPRPQPDLVEIREHLFLKLGDLSDDTPVSRLQFVELAERS